MKLNVIETGRFKLDGGAMFGVVPKKIWTRYNSADEDNLCSWAMRCLLVQDGNRKILIDTGIGSKQDEKFFGFFKPDWNPTLIESLINIHIHPEEITDVFITHLHFDHVGGALYKDENGRIQLQFPNAVYWTNSLHYKWASKPNAREKASFLPENFKHIVDSGSMRMIDVEQNVAFTDRISVRFCYGHTEAMMLPIIKLNSGKTIAYCADLIPSHGHIGLPYIMSYDVRPLDTLKEKIEFYEEALTNRYIIFFEHDKDYECCNIKKLDNGRIVIDQILTLQEALNSS